MDATAAGVAQDEVGAQDGGHYDEEAAAKEDDEEEFLGAGDTGTPEHLWGDWLVLDMFG